MGKKKAAEAVRAGLRLFGYQLAFGLFGLLLTPTLIGLAPMIRMPLIGVMIVAAGMLFFMEGSYRGEKDCAMGDTLAKLGKRGTYHPSDAENAKRYSRLKGVLASLLGVLPVLVVAVYLSLTATPYAYALQDIPGWLSSYTQRPEIGDAVAYAQNLTVTATLTDYARLVVRALLFPYIGFFGQLTDAASLLFDRLSPLFALILPAVAAVGYQFGPSRHAKTVKAIEEAKNKPRKRLKKDAKKRIAPKEPKQLV